MITKPFDPTKPCQTRDGRAARIVDNNVLSAISKQHRLAVIITDRTGYDSIHVYQTNGINVQGHRDWDLINIPKKHKRWVNMYPNNNISINTFNNYNHAKDNRKIHCIATICIEFTEGEGLN